MTRLPVNLTPMRAVTQMRAAVDAFAARYAAARVAAGTDKQPLLDAFRQLEQAARRGDCSLVAQADYAFHETIVRLANVQGLVRVWQAAAEAQEAFRLESIRACWPDLNVLFEAHRPIADAVCAGDQVSAADMAEAHLDAVWYRLADSTGDASLPDDPVARACMYMDFHLHETVRLDFLAKYVARISPGHLARRFRERHGISVSAYLRELRMQKAADLLLRTRLSIKHIAIRVGYQDPSRFTHFFHQRFGYAPRAFRRRFGKTRPARVANPTDPQLPGAKNSRP